MLVEGDFAATTTNVDYDELPLGFHGNNFCHEDLVFPSTISFHFLPPEVKLFETDKSYGRGGVSARGSAQSYRTLSVGNRTNC